MSLSSVIIVPHSPILVPVVAKDSLKQANKTSDFLDKISAELAEKNINTFIIISNHSLDLENSYTLNHCPDFNIDFSQFGDLTTKINVPGDLEISYRIKELTEDSLPVSLTCSQKLDYSISIPLFYINKNNKNFQIIPIHLAKLNTKNHLEFGYKIRKIIDQTSKKIGVIIAGDLARQSDEKNNDSWKEFNQTMIKYLTENKINDFVKQNERQVKNKECILLGLTVLNGILGQTKYKTKIISYEDHLGVGLLIANLNI